MCTYRGLLHFFSHNSLPFFFFLLFFASHVAFAAKKESDGGSSLPSTAPTSPFQMLGECGSSHGIVGALCPPGRESEAKALCLKNQMEGTLTWQPQPDRFLFMSCTYGRVREHCRGWSILFRHKILFSVVPFPLCREVTLSGAATSRSQYERRTVWYVVCGISACCLFSQAYVWYITEKLTYVYKTPRSLITNIAMTI